MTIDNPLPPHLARFVREQVAAGRFQSEDDVIQTALRLLEEQAHSREAAHAWLKQELDRGLSSKPAAPVTAEFWDHRRARVRADAASDRDA